MEDESKQKLRHFEIVDCAVRNAEHFYLMASHVYQLDEDVDDPDAHLREAMRVAVYFPTRPDDKKWGSAHCATSSS